MPDTPQDSAPVPADPDTSNVSRRSVLRTAGAAGVTVAALGAVPAFAAIPAAASDRHGRDNRAELADGEDVVVHVRSVSSGEMDVYRGSSHTRIADRDLAQRLARASR